jgi:hypothetical protein
LTAATLLDDTETEDEETTIEDEDSTVLLLAPVLLNTVTELDDFTFEEDDFCIELLLDLTCELEDGSSFVNRSSFHASKSSSICAT